MSDPSIRKKAPQLPDLFPKLVFLVARSGVHNTCIASCGHSSNIFVACNRARHTLHSVDTAFFASACASHILGTIVSLFLPSLAMHLRLPRQSPGIPSRSNHTILFCLFTGKELFVHNNNGERPNHRLNTNMYICNWDKI